MFHHGGPFVIHPSTGVISTNTIFDRDRPDSYDNFLVPVFVTDKSNRRITICSFKVVIKDINDNKPKFDKSVSADE